MARKLFPDLERGDHAFPTLVANLLPPGLVGLVLAGLIAAIMSHISGALNSCTTIATIDFYLPYINPKASEKTAVRFGKLTGVFLLLMGIVWAQLLVEHTEKPMFLYLFDAYGYFAPGIATMFLLGILWKRTTNAGALAAGLLTIPLSIVLQVLLPDWAGLNRATIVFWSCMATAVVVSLFTTPRPEAEIRHLIWNKESLKLPPDQREKMRGLKNPVFWWALVTAALILLYIRYA